MKNWYLYMSLSILFCYSCSGDEDILSVDQLYSDELVDEFSVFDPCDTIKAPDYSVIRAASGASTIGRLFSLKTPTGEFLFLGRSSEDNTEFDKRKLFYHGMTIVDNILSDPIFILSEDRIGVAGFENIMLISQQDTYDSRYLFLSSINSLASGTFNAGDLFKVRLFEIEEISGDFLIVNTLLLDAISGNGVRPIYNYRETESPLPGSREFAQIEEFITQLKAGAFPFDEQAQAEKFDLQLALHQRDFRFARGLLNSDLLSRLSSENQAIVESLDRMINAKTITSLFCLTDDKKWTVSDDVGFGIPSSYD